MTLRLNGSTSGYVEIDAPAVAGTSVLTLPTGTGTIAKTTDQGLVHINTTTFTTQASVSINNVFTATYDNYRIVYDSTLSGNVAFNMRFRVGGTDTTTNYSYQNSQFSTAAGISQALSQTLIQVFGASGAARFNIATEVFTPFLTSATGIINHYGATGISGLATGTHTASTSFDGFTIYPATGTISGSLRVYGYKNGA